MPDQRLRVNFKEFCKAHPEVWRDLDEHFELAALFAYHEGRLAPEDEIPIRAHILVCKSCREKLLDIGAFLFDSQEPARFWSTELASAWLEIQKALREEPVASTP
jgi:anti-sigma factor ChrR (cupin superfamily)